MLRRQQDLPISAGPAAGLAGKCPAASRSGFTLVEMMVAVVILSIGLLGLAGTAGVVTRQVGGGAKQTAAANVAEARMETLRSLGCSRIASGTATTRGVYEHWVRGDTVNRVLWVRDTVKYSVAGREKQTHVYIITVPCS
jgi:prepilin-type N-terminal cleavage/methylation domain-containing protein